MDRLGIIGGLGPLASAYYLELLVKMSKATCDQDHMEVYMYSCPQIPDRTAYILNQEKAKSPLPKLLELCEKLEKDQVKMIAIPCITAHYFHKELETKCRVPIIHGIKESARYLEKRGVKNVGIMATDGTIETKIFQKELELVGLHVIIPEGAYQDLVKDIIYEQVKKGYPVQRDSIELVERHLKERGVDVILLGCTELSIAKKENKVGSGFLDVLEVLARTAIKNCGQLKEEYEELIT